MASQYTLEEMPERMANDIINQIDKISEQDNIKYKIESDYVDLRIHSDNFDDFDDFAGVRDKIKK